MCIAHQEPNDDTRESSSEKNKHHDGPGLQNGRSNGMGLSGSFIPIIRQEHHTGYVH